MTRERRIRDEVGGNYYYNIDEPSDWVTGAGVFNIIKDVTTKVASKLTGKAAKKIAEKAIEKGAEKVGEKTGEKLGVLIGEKIYDTFSHSKTPNPRGSVGDLIIKELSEIKMPPGEPRRAVPTVSQQFKDVNNTLPGEKSISQQFDELLLRFQ